MSYMKTNLKLKNLQRDIDFTRAYLNKRKKKIKTAGFALKAALYWMVDKWKVDKK